MKDEAKLIFSIENIWDQPAYQQNTAWILNNMPNSPLKDFYDARIRLENLRNNLRNQVHQSELNAVQQAEFAEIQQLFIKATQSDIYGNFYYAQQAYAKALFAYYYGNEATIVQNGYDPTGPNAQKFIQNLIADLKNLSQSYDFAPAANFAAKLLFDSNPEITPDMNKLYLATEKNGYPTGKIGKNYLSHITGELSKSQPKPFHFPSEHNARSAIKSLLDAIEQDNHDVMTYAVNYLKNADDGARRILAFVEKNGQHVSGKEVSDAQLVHARLMVAISDEIEQALLRKNYILPYTITVDKHGIESREYRVNKEYKLLTDNNRKELQNVSLAVRSAHVLDVLSRGIDELSTDLIEPKLKALAAKGEQKSAKYVFFETILYGAEQSASLTIPEDNLIKLKQDITFAKRGTLSLTGAVEEFQKRFKAIIERSKEHVVEDAEYGFRQKLTDFLHAITSKIKQAFSGKAQLPVFSTAKTREEFVKKSNTLHFNSSTLFATGVKLFKPSAAHIRQVMQKQQDNNSESTEPKGEIKR